jgi:diguanylate cyclase (GGDEF)-like protein/PAS domain S-box-containing protein
MWQATVAAGDAGCDPVDSGTPQTWQVSYRDLFETSLGIFILAPDACVLDCNDSFLAMAGASREQVIGFNMLRAAEDPALIPFLRQALAGTEVRFETQYTSTTGHRSSIYRYHFKPLDPAVSGTACVLCFAEDVGPLRKMEDTLRALKLSEEKFAKAFDASPDPMILSAIDSGKVLDINAGFTEQYGYTREETLGRTTLDIGLWADPAQRATTAALMRANGELRNHEVDFRTKDGRIVTVLGSATQITIDGIEYWLVQFRDITERKRLLLALEEQARTDYLTGLANRRYFMERAEQEASRIKRHGGGIAMLMLDLDHFKRVNDQHGHRAGDQILCAFANCCRLALRDIDIVARMGGEEFAILLLETSSVNAREIAERIRRTTADIVVVAENGDAIRVTVSIGIATTDAANVSIDKLLGDADRALYRAKEMGRNRVV